MNPTLVAAFRDTIRRLCVPPDTRTVTEWAEAERILPETSASPGPYRADLVPYARRPQDLMADPDVRKVVLCWAAQTTKSTCIENAVAYRIVNRPSPMVVVQPKIDSAESWAKERFVPMVLATPALRSRVRLGRATDSTLRYKRFAGGFVFVASSQSESELASRSTPFLLLDEVDRYEMGSEGNPVEIALRRQAATDIYTAVLTSTPGEAEASLIWPELERGTYELYHVPCPHCGTLQPLVWAQLRWEPGAPETAHYVCLEGCVIEERHKRAMLTAGQWVATNPDGAWPSFHLNALYSPFAASSWAVLAAEFLRAKDRAGDFQVFTNTRLAECFTESTEAISAHELTGRLEPFARDTVPVGVGLITAGLDVQANRVEAYAWGWGDKLESWLIAHEVFPGDPMRERTDPDGPWPAVEAWLARTFPTDAGHQLGIAAAALDTGYQTTQCYRVLQGIRRKTLIGVKGVGGAGVPFLGKVGMQGNERVPVLPIGVDAAKTEFYRSHLLAPPGPGRVHLPDWLSLDVLEQLTGERRHRRTLKGRPYYEWRPKRPDAPVEALDCRVYARAVLELTGALGQLAERAAALAIAPLTPAPPPPPTAADRAVTRRPPPAPPRRAGWLSGFSL